MLAQESKKASWEEQSNLSHMYWAGCQLFANMPKPPGCAFSQVCHSDQPASFNLPAAFQCFGSSKGLGAALHFSHANSFHSDTLHSYTDQ